MQELLLILAILLIIFGPAKVLDLSKELGRAVREFNRARSQFTELTATNLEDVEEVDSKELIEIAQKLNIQTEGKSTIQLIKEVNMKIDKKEKV